MKNKTPLLVALFALAIFVGCKKEKEILEPKKSNHENPLALETEMEVVDGIPRYASVTDYQAIEENLREAYETAMDNVEAEFELTGDEITDQQYDAGLSYEIRDYINQPFTDFETNVGLSSYREDMLTQVDNWLSLQDTTDFDSTSNPDTVGIELVQRSMINSDRSFAVGDDYYHICNDLSVIKVEGLGNLSTLQYIEANEVAVLSDFETYSANKQTSGITVVVNTFGGANQGDCRVNTSSKITKIPIDSKTRCNAIHSIYYLFFATKAYVEVPVFHHSNVFGWMPAVTKGRIGINVWTYTNYCTFWNAIWTGESNTRYGTSFTRGETYWSERRQTQAGAISGNIPSNGLWGYYRIKDMNYTATQSCLTF